MARLIPIQEEIFEVEEKRNSHALPIQYTVNEMGCHICGSHDLDKNSYPRLRRNGKKFRMNRYIYELYHGEIPEGKLVMHTCDNPQCINPEHLSLGTHRENMEDRQRKGRTKSGCEHGKSKLSVEQVYYIRFKRTESVKELADKYHVNETTIRKIISGISYKKITIDSCPDLQKTAV